MFFFLIVRQPTTSTLFPYTTLFRSGNEIVARRNGQGPERVQHLIFIRQLRIVAFVPRREHVNDGARDEHGNRRQRSEEHTSELQSRGHLVCRLLLEKKKKTTHIKIL